MQIAGYLVLIRSPPCSSPVAPFPALDQSSLSQVTSRNFLQEKMGLGSKSVTRYNNYLILQ